MLDKNYEPQDPYVPKKKRLRRNPVDKLGNTIKTYKTERISAEENLKKMVLKVNLDK